ncbi:MAG TPA: exodeoxyribonuclease VII large subunit [Xanthomonadaceae bacterium]|nr:exodeoxyribonuclease VII large subunit [Xanthomonadaceae bacterium]
MNSPAPTDVLRPAQLNALARDLLEGTFPSVWVEGEISNLARPRSGHLYFTLKDERAQVRCALFRGRSTRLRFQPADGMQVLVRGRLTLYEPRGDYQLVLEHMEEAGEGALRRAFEELKARLAAEGLFDAGRKRALPRFPRRIAVVTSPSGAAIRDVLNVLGRRFPMVEVDVFPAQVQGSAAPAQLLAALTAADASGRYDVLLLTRGGGSLEDLWAFNDEALARAVAATATPTVCAVGHEVDFSIADFAADVRAPTPSAAAELMVPDAGELSVRVRKLGDGLAAASARRLREAAQRSDHAWARLRGASPQARLERGRERLRAAGLRLRRCAHTDVRGARQRVLAASQRLRATHPRRALQLLRQRIDEAGQRVQAAMPRLLRTREEPLRALVRALHAVSPLATLGRGYAIVLDAGSGAVIRRTGEARPGQLLDIRVTDGTIPAKVR